MGFWEWVLCGSVIFTIAWSFYALGSSPQVRAESTTPYDRKALFGRRKRNRPDGTACRNATGEFSDEEEESVDRWWDPAEATLVEPPEVERPEMPTEARAVESLLVSQLDGHDLRIPPLAGSAERVLQRLRDRKASLTEVAEVIAEDQVVATAVMRMANSPLYRGSQKITALNPAVVRLGATAIKTLMLQESLRVATFSRRGAASELGDMLWQRSVASAWIAHGLSAFTDVDPDDMFLLGLVQDIGNVMVLQTVEQWEPTVGYQLALEEFEYLCSAYHERFGGLIAANWSLPGQLQEIIRDHHGTPDVDDPSRAHRLLLQLTDMINGMIGYAPPRAYKLLETRPVRDLGLRDRSDFLTFLEGLPDQVEQSICSVGGPGSH